jgi:membrane dipeptidase
MVGAPDLLICDAHLDLAMNALEWNRDLSRPIDEIRSREQGLTDKPDRTRGTVSFAEMRRGRVGLCVATQIARSVARDNPLPGWHSQEQAWATTQGQLAWYRAMEERGELVLITSREALDRHLGRWQTSAADGLPIGYVLSLEGADSIDAVAPRARVRAGPARGWPGALRAGRVRAGHACNRRPDRPRPRAAARDGAAWHHPRRHASL